MQEQAEEEEERERERGKRVAFFKGIINSLNALVLLVTAEFNIPLFILSEKFLSILLVLLKCRYYL